MTDELAMATPGQSAAQLSSAPVSEYFDRLSADYHLQYRDSRKFRQRRERFAELLRRYAGWSLSALDFGCGAGNLTPLLAEISDNVVAVDASAEMRAMASQRLAHLANTRVKELDKLEGSAFDLVLCSSVIEYVKADAELLRQFAGWMRPGGLLLITLPNRFGVAQNVARWLPSQTETCRLQQRLYRRSQAVELLGRHFDVLESSASIGLPLARNLGMGELIICAARRRRESSSIG
ncbi:MAG: class I SAM-dependent methyltransferase [Pirellulales bacterium]|nr:class I SAM-dependent methyltransferase [Pirellulales bacterium]